MPKKNDLAKAAWEGYSKQAGGVAVDGQPLPTWEELGTDRQECWIAAIGAALHHLIFED